MFEDLGGSSDNADVIGGNSGISAEWKIDTDA